MGGMIWTNNIRIISHHSRSRPCLDRVPVDTNSPGVALYLWVIVSDIVPVECDYRGVAMTHD